MAVNAGPCAVEAPCAHSALSTSPAYRPPRPLSRRERGLSRRDASRTRLGVAFVFCCCCCRCPAPPVSAARASECRRGRRGPHVWAQRVCGPSPAGARSAGYRPAEPVGRAVRAVLSFWLLFLCTSKEKVTRPSREAAGESSCFRGLTLYGKPIKHGAPPCPLLNPFPDGVEGLNAYCTS